MAGKFKWCKFSEVNLGDPFFDSLKSDYTEFPSWFLNKSKQNESVLVFKDEQGIGAFLYLKDEAESIALTEGVLPAVPRIKIGTLRIAERCRSQRLGEGAVGVALWRWQEKQFPEIYVTVFEKHNTLISLFERFGFKNVGTNNRGERLYVKSRYAIDYSTPYTAFPFINPNFYSAGILPIYESYHDRLFPYSELMGNKKEIEEITAGNGITKIYLATPNSGLSYRIGDLLAIYRIFQGTGQKTYKSVVTCFCTISDILYIKAYGRANMSYEEFIHKSGNKTVFSGEELCSLYNCNNNIIMLELVYNGFFGKGHNVTHRELKDRGLFQSYPYTIKYDRNQFLEILKMGDVNVQNVIID